MLLCIRWLGSCRKHEMAIHFLAWGQDLLDAESQKARFSQDSSRHRARLSKNWFYGPDYRRVVFRQEMWEEHRSSVSPLLQLSAGSAKLGLHYPASHLNGPQSRGAGFSALVVNPVYEAVL